MTAAAGRGTSPSATGRQDPPALQLRHRVGMADQRAAASTLTPKRSSVGPNTTPARRGRRWVDELVRAGHDGEMPLETVVSVGRSPSGAPQSLPCSRAHVSNGPTQPVADFAETI